MCMLCQWQRAKRGSRLQGGGAASEGRDGKREGESDGGEGGAEMSVGVPLKEYCLRDNAPGLLGLSVLVLLWVVLRHKQANFPAAEVPAQREVC